MRSRGRKSRDRIRTIWTSEMDRYFLDLMLEQVGKGNKTDDHLFTKNAWMEMDSLFSAKFKIQNENDVLKNRHKTLRNLYRSVKTLLDQRGFCWDETRQMVTADNSIWNEYIKVHPEARSYRIKPIPNYRDLCLIFADATNERKGCDSKNDKNLVGSAAIEPLEHVKSPTTSNNDGRPGDSLPEPSSHLRNKVMEQPAGFNGAAMEALHDIMIDEDYGNSESKKDVDDATQVIPEVPCSIISPRTRTYWQPPMDRYFIELMLEQVQKGNQVDGLFRKEAWMEMIALFNAKFGFGFDVEILKNRHKTMRRQYNAIQNLLELDGFVWDESRQMVTADDHVWQDYIKVHTDARQYMTRPIPYYKDLLVICRDSSANDGEYFPNQNLENGETPEAKFGGALRSSHPLAASASNDDQFGSTPDSYDTDFHNHFSDQKSKRPLEVPFISAHTVKAMRKDEFVPSTATVVSIEHVVEAVQALPDMDEDLVLDACDFLEEERKAKTFLALDVKLRKKWLMRKLRPNNQ